MRRVVLLMSVFLCLALFHATHEALTFGQALQYDNPTSEIIKRLKWQIDQMSHFTCDAIETRKFVDKQGLVKREVSYVNRLKFGLEDRQGYKLVQYNSVQLDRKGLYDTGLATVISVLMSEYKWAPTNNPFMFYLTENSQKPNENTIFEGAALLGDDFQIQFLTGGFKHLSYGIKHLNVVYQFSPVYSHDGVVYLPSLVVLSAKSKGLLVSDGYNELRMEYSNWRDRRLSAPSLEMEILGLINAVRRQHKLATLEYSTQLADGAREHSKNLALYGHGDDLHKDVQGRGFPQRAKYGAKKEIVLFTNEKEPIAMVNRWLASPSHKEAIVSNASKSGVGIYEKDGVYYVTQWFK